MTSKVIHTPTKPPDNSAETKPSTSKTQDKADELYSKRRCGESKPEYG